MTTLDGIFPPLHTPFRDDEVDLDAVGANIRTILGAPLRGIVVLGTNGEAPLLDEEESVAVVRAARAAVPRDRVLIAGTGRQSTRETILATRRAADAGADAVLVRTPSFYKNNLTAEAFVRHYQALADASPVPVLLYNFTAFTGVTLPPAAVARLAQHPNIVGMKESGSDAALLAEYVASAPASFSVLAGSGQTFFTGLLLGARGAILALAVVAPELCVRVFDLVRSGRIEEARDLQRRLVPLAQSITTRFGIAGLKVAAGLTGLYGGSPRGPLGPAPPEAAEVLRRQLSELEVPVA
jgi:4-hydroxy-2-oxoglutarate aldolase